MFNYLPVTFIFSLLLWAAVFYIFVGCFQLIVFDKVVKRENPNIHNYRSMSDDQKKNIKKIGWKIVRGLVALLALAFIDHNFIT